MTASPPLSLADLEQRLARTEPAALLVPPRILRRVIKKDRQVAGVGLQVPHRKSYVIARDALLAIADRDELGAPPDRPLPDTLLLFPRPDPGRLAARSAGVSLLRLWRLLFHTRIHQALGQAAAAGRLTDADLRERIQTIGTTEFEEIAAVLRQERFLLPPGDARTVYEEFAALYLELRFFEPYRLSHFFPDLAGREDVERLLAQDVEAPALFAATRPEGAADPAQSYPENEEDDGPADLPEETVELTPSRPDEALHQRLLAWADRAAVRGNLVRSAVLRQRAVRVAPPGQVGATRQAARQPLEELAARLQRAVGFPEADLPDWRRGLLALLEPAARGIWSRAARFLYDLQQACVDAERPVYAVDLVEWAVTWGRQPVQRLLPHQGLVLQVKHLRRADHRLTAVPLSERLRRALTDRLHAAIHLSEHSLRETFRPRVRHALDAVGLQPAGVAERLARDKLIEELLDRVVEHGYLTIGDLRDAMARNQMKLPDLAGPGEFFLGDPLIRANRQFAHDLDGVYRRGEIYMRWLQRLSATAFGTRAGRFLTRYLVLPFGGAYVVLMGLAEIVGLIHHHTGERIKATIPATLVPLGVLFFLLLHAAPFRHAVATGLRGMWAGVRGLCYDLPAFVLGLPAVRRLLQNRYYLLFFQFVFRPLIVAGPLALGLPLTGVPPPAALTAAAAAFLVAVVLLNSRAGLQVEEAATDAAVRTWQLIRQDVLPGLVRLVMYLFKRLIEGVERLLYAVDEFLRFRQGDSRFALLWKPGLGLLWFAVTYVVRVVINLFVEPTINPIKHFPVVTVAAKLMAPAFLITHPLMVTALAPWVGKLAGNAVAATVEILLPGLAGFLVWELKENWKLYRANRPTALQPVLIGSHGETMLRFMKPGFHSGTLPKLYARLRRRKGRPARKQAEALHHARESLGRFLDRELLAVLQASRRWGDVPVPRLGRIDLGTNRVRYALLGPGAEPVRLDFEEHAGQLTAGLDAPADSWLAHLEPGPAAALRDALAGLYKRAGVEAVSEQLQGEQLERVVVSWDEWVEAWERDQAGKSCPPLAAGVRLLPLAEPCAPASLAAAGNTGVG